MYLNIALSRVQTSLYTSQVLFLVANRAYLTHNLRMCDSIFEYKSEQAQVLCANFFKDREREGVVLCAQEYDTFYIKTYDLQTMQQSGEV